MRKSDGQPAKTSAASQPEISSLHAVVSGRVQNVGFRYFVQREARKRELTGVVRNLPDGRVDVLAQGPEPALRQLLDLLRRGPLFSRVDDVDAQWNPSVLTATDFSIGY